MLLRIGIFCGSAYVVGHDWRVIWRDQYPMDDAVPSICVGLFDLRQDGLYSICMGYGDGSDRFIFMKVL